jgi:hypothetical protein
MDSSRRPRLGNVSATPVRASRTSETSSGPPQAAPSASAASTALPLSAPLAGPDAQPWPHPRSLGIPLAESSSSAAEAGLPSAEGTGGGQGHGAPVPAANSLAFDPLDGGGASASSVKRLAAQFGEKQANKRTGGGLERLQSQSSRAAPARSGSFTTGVSASTRASSSTPSTASPATQLAPARPAPAVPQPPPALPNASPVTPGAGRVQLSPAGPPGPSLSPEPSFNATGTDSGGSSRMQALTAALVPVITAAADVAASASVAGAVRCVYWCTYLLTSAVWWTTAWVVTATAATAWCAALIFGAASLATDAVAGAGAAWKGGWSSAHVVDSAEDSGSDAEYNSAADSPQKRGAALHAGADSSSSSALTRLQSLNLEVLREAARKSLRSRGSPQATTRKTGLMALASPSSSKAATHAAAAGAQAAAALRAAATEACPSALHSGAFLMGMLLSLVRGGSDEEAME